MNTDQIPMDSLDNKYLCSICQLVMLDPFIILTCKHELCKNCLEAISYSYNNKKKCPFCKCDFNKADVNSNEKLKLEIESTQKLCLCKQSIQIIKWDNHIEKCQDYQINLKQNIKETVVKDAKQ